MLNGNFYFDSGLSAQLSGWVIFILAIFVVVFSVNTYRKTTRPLAKPWKIGLTLLRMTTLMVVLLFLFNPSVEVSEVIPQETYVAVLVDDSQSMSIADDIKDKENKTRLEKVKSALYETDKLIDQLSKNFQVRTYRFSDMAQRVTGEGDFSQSGGRSLLSSGINHVMSELSSFPIAGVVLLSDGADNGVEDPLLSAERMVDKNIPLYAVGVGEEKIEQDVSITTVNVDKSLLEGSIYTVNLSVEQKGFNNRRIDMTVTSGENKKGGGTQDDGEVEPLKTISSQSIVLKESGIQRQTLEIKPDKKDILVYTLNVDEQEGETVVKNNHYTFFIDNREKPPLDILYVEGQPRNEYKFIRRAVKDDKSLRLATYLQTGPRKYLRQGIKSPAELSTGFPLTEENLYEYEAIIFGNVDRSFFNDKQLELVQKFVAKRGGGFMLIGGLQESFVDSPIADILPVELVRKSQLPSFLQGGPRRGDHLTGQAFMPRLTKEGELSPLLRLSSDARKNRADWKAMPELEGVYVSGRAKPGASVLLEHPSLDYQSAALPILTAQRYGAGRSLAFSTASSWRWQMLLPHEDQSHEKIWRQMLRWLSIESEKRLSVELNEENYSVGDQVKISATLLDETFTPDNNGVLWVEVKDPNANVSELPMVWDLQKEGTYNALLQVSEEGVYDLKVKVPSDTDINMTAQTPLIVTSSRREFLNAEMDSGLLARLAKKTGGDFYRIDQMGKLIDDITYSPTPYSKQETRSIWDQPFFLYLLISFMCLEWFGRRYKGLS